MIKVKLKKHNKNLVGFHICGHAEYSDYGKDIVCAATTMLTFNTIDTFTDLLLLDDYLNINIKDNDIDIKLIKNLNENQNKDFQLIMKKFELGINSLIQSYGEYIELNYLEV